MLKRIKILFASMFAVTLNLSVCFAVVEKVVDNESIWEKIFSFCAPWISAACYIGILFIFYKVIPRLAKLSLQLSEVRKKNKKGEENPEAEKELQAECDDIKRKYTPMICILFVVGTILLIINV